MDVLNSMVVLVAVAIGAKQFSRELRDVVPPRKRSERDNALQIVESSFVYSTEHNQARKPNIS